MDITKENTKQKRGDVLIMAGAVVIAGVLIAGAVMYGKGIVQPLPSVGGGKQKTAENASIENIKPISESDHILGSKDAPVKLIEYTDTECPFCKKFHDVVVKVMDTYGKEGKVAFVLRHFPLESLHAKARTEANALECAGIVGGEDAFWKYTNKLFEITPSNDGFEPAQLPFIAQGIGLDVNRFTECTSQKKGDAKVAADIEDGLQIGVKGTPFSVIVAPNGKKYSVDGAQPYNQVVSIIELALKQDK